MTGPEHYRAAERLADQANHFTYGDGADPVVGAALAAEAQVHATLALAAATALNDDEGGMTERDHRGSLTVEAEVCERAEDEAYTLNKLYDARTERDAARVAAVKASTVLYEQIDRSVRAENAAAILQSATDAANRRINLALTAAAELHEFNSPDADEHRDGCPGCRLEHALGPMVPDPRTRALELLADRYPTAFEHLLADEQAKATRKEAHR